MLCPWLDQPSTTKICSRSKGRWNIMGKFQINRWGPKYPISIIVRGNPSPNCLPSLIQSIPKEWSSLPVVIHRILGNKNIPENIVRYHHGFPLGYCGLTFLYKQSKAKASAAFKQDSGIIISTQPRHRPVLFYTVYW